MRGHLTDFIDENPLKYRIDFSGSGDAIIELIRLLLHETDKERQYLTHAYKHPTWSNLGEGRVSLTIIIDDPEKERWQEITYSHHEGTEKGSGYIIFTTYYYHRKPLPELENWENEKFEWGYSFLTAKQILKQLE
ncbi:hypothetical protein J7K42_00075 [bacterium]|nr:hypothetical protein [bacterium]